MFDGIFTATSDSWEDQVLRTSRCDGRDERDL